MNDNYSKLVKLSIYPIELRTVIFALSMLSANKDEIYQDRVEEGSVLNSEGLDQLCEKLDQLM